MRRNGGSRTAVSSETVYYNTIMTIIEQNNVMNLLTVL